MNFHTQRGFYSPSYYKIKLATSYNIAPLDKLPVQVQSVFFHEYFHFLQDVTSEFGYSSGWNAYDRIRQIIAHYQKSTGDIELPPVENEQFEQSNSNLNYYFAQSGDIGPATSNNQQISDPLRIKSYRVTPAHDKFRVEANSGIKFIQLNLLNDEGKPATYWFGGIAIVESMTHLIQRKYFGENEHPDLPYKAAIIFANFLSEKLRDKEEFIFALCDLSICTPSPGQTFLELILEIDSWETTNITTEEIYKFGLHYISSKWCNSSSKEGLRHQLSQIFGHEIFNNEREWLTQVLEAGNKLRRSEPQFMLELYRNSRPFEGKFYEVYKLLGVPEVINSIGNRWFAAPPVMRGKQDSIHTVFLSAFKQLHDLFLFGKKDCALYDHCFYSEPKMPTDDQCKTAPWLKAKEKAICPFGAVWVAFGLQSRNITFRK
ncbi:MAG: hypothetical protein KF862_12325 [Chitinophagaceae bacterium]|nr:hypothetical protein [Chitinophagaceae bacterium]